MESESQSTASVSAEARVSNWIVWIGTNRALFLMIPVVVLIALIPLYGVLFPPLVDLPEHLLISKLLWEKLSGISRLDLEVSWFLGYRLFPALMMVVIPFCKLWGISFVYLPNIVATALMSLHATVVVVIVYCGLRNKSWKSCTLAVCFAIPAAVCMYSACWFIGFVNYTLAITLLIPAVFLTERFLRTGKLSDASLLFLTLVIVYAAHPFALAFWLAWCFSRAFAGIVTASLLREWKRILSLGVLFVPIVLYHLWATAGTTLAPTGRSFVGLSPFISSTDWYQYRLRGLYDGIFLKADDASDSKVFAVAAIAFILSSIVLVFRPGQDRNARKMMLSCVGLALVCSWINEKFIPVPGGAWLAYDYRFSSTSYAICLAVAAMVLARSLPRPTDKLRYKVICVVLGAGAVLASMDHLIEVRQAYARFDDPARRYMAKVFSREQPTGITLPHGQYHRDGTYLNNYVCLTQPDCNAPGTTFAAGYVSDLYPVKVRSPRRMSIGPLVGFWKLDETSPGDACLDSSGNENGGTPYGTTVVEGKVSKARSFNGRSDYIHIPTINIPDAITVAAWVYSDNFVQDGFVVTKNPVNTQWALFFGADGFVRWRGAGSIRNVPCAAPSNHKWHHIVGKQQGTMGSLYIDGVRCGSGTLEAIGNAPSTITIGRYDTINYHYFTGRIDEVRIYDRALSDGEISQLFNAAK
ncbi:MAG TPA: LamG domain-containing protein [Chthoniobacterales bacterium]|nr:LamG domain-containing protein [Chthoniobacterales bacterium]